MKPSQKDLSSSKNPPQPTFLFHKNSLEEEKQYDLNPSSSTRPNQFDSAFGQILDQSLDSNDQDDEFYYQNSKKNASSYFNNENYKKYCNYIPSYKQIANLYAIDGFASLAAEEPPYIKTYQDQIDVNHLVDLFGTNKSYNLDKMFGHADSPSPKGYQFNGGVPMLANQNSGRNGNNQILCDDFFQIPAVDQNNEDLSKLFEDPQEKLQKIQMRIQESQLRKRMRFNSGSSNQSKQRLSPHKFQQKEENLTNIDLLKAFDQKLQNQHAHPNFDQIQYMLNSQDLNQRMVKAMENAKKNVRMEDPNRIMTRLAFDFMSELMQGYQIQFFNKNQHQMQDQQWKNMNSQMEKLQVLSQKQSSSDQMSLSQDPNSKSQSFNQNKRRYNNWSEKEESILINELKQKDKKLNELNEQDWIEISNKLKLTQSQVFWKAKRLLKQEDKTILPQTESKIDPTLPKDKIPKEEKIPKKDLILKVLSSLPNKRGSKNEIFNELSQQHGFSFNNKHTSLYKSFEQALSKHFYKIPQVYILSEKFQSLSQKDQGSLTMKNMLIQCLLCLPKFQGTIKEIKHVMMRKYHDKLLYDKKEELSLVGVDSNLQQWEKTILKTIARHKNIFLKQKAIFQIDSTEQTLQVLEEEEDQMSEDQNTQEYGGGGKEKDRDRGAQVQRISHLINQIKFKKIIYSNQ